MRSHRASQRQLPETLLGNYRRQYRTVLCMGKHRLAHDSDRYARIPLHLPSLFPMASLYPGYFNHLRLLIFLLPPVIIITIGMSYLYFNGHLTPLYSLNEIGEHIGETDIRLRVCIFLISILLPLASFIFPLASRRAFRRINRNMYFFIGFMFLFLGIYITFTLNINEFVFNLFGIVALVFTLFFSTLYLFRENPFSDHIQMLPPDGQEEEASLQTSPLFASINTYLKEYPAYTNKGYTLKALAGALDKKERQISQAIKSEGFTGFREYINYLRLEHFKQLATEDPNKNIKELMYLCGFTSRTTFYRNFAEKFGISPTQFIENLQKNAGIIEEYD